MKNKLRTTLIAGLAGLALSVCLDASAVQYLDNDVPGNLSSGATYSGTFTLIAPGDGSGSFGYDPSSEVVASTVVDFSFRNLTGLGSKVAITIGGIAFIGTEVAGTFTHLVGDVGAALATLSSTGSIDYTIKNLTTSRITITGAALTAQAVATSVPDGGATLLFLGMGLLGVGYVGKRSSKVTNS